MAGTLSGLFEENIDTCKTVDGSIKAQLLSGIQEARNKGTAHQDVLDIMEELLVTDSFRVMSDYVDK